MAVRQEVNNLDRSVVVQEVELCFRFDALTEPLCEPDCYVFLY